LFNIISYIPKCEFGCNDGFCANDDYCDCTNSTLKGKYCNEYEQLQRYPILDFFVIGIAGVIIIGTIVLIGMTLNYKNHPIIKGGNNIYIYIIINFKLFISNFIYYAYLIINLIIIILIFYRWC